MLLHLVMHLTNCSSDHLHLSCFTHLFSSSKPICYANQISKLLVLTTVSLRATSACPCDLHLFLPLNVPLVVAAQMWTDCHTVKGERLSPGLQARLQKLDFCQPRVSLCTWVHVDSGDMSISARSTASSDSHPSCSLDSVTISVMKRQSNWLQQ